MLNEILKNINELEESIRLSHHTERMIFQNEIQLQIDKHRLEYELDREKLKNARLIRLNGIEKKCQSLPNKDVQHEVKFLKSKCQELTILLKRRSNQLFKALAQIKDLKADKENLKSKLKVRSSKLKEISKEHAETITRLNKELEMSKKDAEKARNEFLHSDIQVALQEQMKHNKRLMYNNYFFSLSSDDEISD